MADLLRRLETEKRLLDSLSEYVILIGVVQKDTTRKKVVTSIGEDAFYNWEQVPYVEIKAVTPPSIASSIAFIYQNNAPIYVPDESVDDYKTATNWIDLASRIFSINDK